MELFREKNIERISSPEQLNSYIKTIGVPVWLVLAAIIALAAALFVWGIFGRITTEYNVKALVKNGSAVCFLSDTSEISEGMSVRIAGCEGTVKNIGNKPIHKSEAADIIGDDYAVYVMSPDEWCFQVTIEANGAEDGISDAAIVKNSEAPISFLID